jgi:hypothetical protein
VNQKTSGCGTSSGGEWANVKRCEKLVCDAINQRTGDDCEEDTSEDRNDPFLLIGKLGDSCKGKFRVHFDER